MSSYLEREFHTFEANEESLLKEHEGEFVLIYGSEIIGTYPTQDEAFKAGNEKFNTTPYFIGEIGKKNVVLHPALVGWY